MMDNSYGKPVYSGDDIASDNATWQNNQNLTTANIYVWADRIYTNTEEDPDWANNYKQIYQCNLINAEVMSSKGGTQAQKEAVLAAALVHRANAYFTLVNLYGKQYDATTSVSDLGVPLVTATNFTASLKRATVKEVYDFVLADLHKAIPALPATPDFISNPSKAAAYALLSRVYLNMRNFSEAERFADLALSLKSTLIDLNNHIAVPPALPTMPLKMLNPEEIFFKKVPSMGIDMPLSADAVNMFTATPEAAKDLRYVNFTVSGSTLWGSPFTTPAYRRMSLTNDGLYTGPSVPEMMLIKAECEARAGNASAAVDILNTLRQKRFKPTEYFGLAAATPEEALKLTIAERKREFMGRGFRWFDQRRLAKDAGFVTTVTRVFKNVTYTLAPGSNRYTFAIGDKYIESNPEIIQNPR